MDEFTTASSAPSSPDDRSAWVQILRGRTSFPQRPFRRQRFLIGAGSHCDLQLAGAGMPLLHSVIALQDEAIVIEAVVPHPPLVVGGRSVREGVLAEDELVEIGPFALVVKRGVPASAGAGLEAPLDIAALLALDQRDAVDLASLSAAELVDRIEAETRAPAIADARRAGYVALLEAVKACAIRPQQASFEDAAARLAALAAQIAADGGRLHEREQQLASQSERLLELHERVISECSRILEDATRAVPEPRSQLRISA